MNLQSAKQYFWNNLKEGTHTMVYEDDDCNIEITYDCSVTGEFRYASDHIISEPESEVVILSVYVVLEDNTSCDITDVYNSGVIKWPETFKITDHAGEVLHESLFQNMAELHDYVRVYSRINPDINLKCVKS